MVKIEVVRLAVDARGYVFEPLQPEVLGQLRNVHVAYSVPGAVRGNHYHERGTEVCSVIGPALVRYRIGAATHDAQVPVDAVWRFTFPPGVAHAVRNEGAQPTLLVAFNTEAHDSEHPDVVREVLID